LLKVVLPEIPQATLAANIPQVDVNAVVGQGLDVETESGCNVVYFTTWFIGVFVLGKATDLVRDGALASIVKAENQQSHFLGLHFAFFDYGKETHLSDQDSSPVAAMADHQLNGAQTASGTTATMQTDGTAGECNPTACLEKYKHILAWQNPVRTSAVLLFLVVFTCTKFTQPIWSAMLRGTLIMLLACATAKIASIKFDRANDFLDVFARFRGSHLEELVSRANKCQMCMMKSILDVLTMQNPIKAAVWATALFITLQMVTETLLLVVTLVMILFLFAMYPVSKRLGIDAEPMLKQCVKTLSGAMCSLSRSAGLAAGGAANAKKD